MKESLANYIINLQDFRTMEQWISRNIFWSEKRVLKISKSSLRASWAKKGLCRGGEMFKSN